jgi:hypothetical protein
VTSEFILVFGIVIGILTIPSMFRAAIDGNPPRAAALAIVVAGGMIVYAVYTTPGGFSVNELPDMFTRVVKSFL